MNKILKEENIKINLPSKNKDEAIEFAGQHLIDLGYVTKEYIQSMINRENNLTTYIGNHVAIPHGETGSSEFVKNTGIIFHHYIDGVKFGNEKVHFIIGIASNDDFHLEILANVAQAFSDIDFVNNLLNEEITTQKVLELLKGE